MSATTTRKKSERRTRSATKRVTLERLRSTPPPEPVQLNALVQSPNKRGQLGRVYSRKLLIVGLRVRAMRLRAAEFVVEDDSVNQLVLDARSFGLDAFADEFLASIPEPVNTAPTHPAALAKQRDMEEGGGRRPRPHVLRPRVQQAQHRRLSGRDMLRTWTNRHDQWPWRPICKRPTRHRCRRVQCSCGGFVLQRSWLHLRAELPDYNYQHEWTDGERSTHASVIRTELARRRAEASR